MKHKLLFAAAAAALMAPSVAAAQDSGVYLRGQLGYGVFGDTEFVVDNDADFTTRNAVVGSSGGLLGGSNNAIVGDVGASGDVAYSLGLGYDFGNSWRIEADTSSLFNDLGQIGGNPANFAKIRANTLMGNLLYDFSDFGRFQPYVGAGIGIVQGNVSAQAHDLLNPNFLAGTDLDQNGIDRRGTSAVIRHPNCVTGTIAANLSRNCFIDDEDTNFAWNLIAGLGYAVTPNLHWDTSYRYTDMGSFDLDGAVNVFNGQGSLNQDATLESDLEDVSSHMLMTGLRYRFGASTPKTRVTYPPLPPIPVMVTCADGTEVTDAAFCPPPVVEVQTFTCEGSGQTVTDLALCPPRTECPDGSIVYGPIEFCPTRSGLDQATLCADQFRQEIIYYEFDRGQSAETRNTINRILDIGDFCQVGSIRVVGHTDTSGAASYNLNLSRRRAKDALDELVRQGIDRNIITSEGKGETEPFVQTGDGVKEQLNRRTEVLIQLSDVGTGSLFNN